MQKAECEEACEKPCSEVNLLPDILCVLLVGEGNLSFTYALVKRLSRSRLVRRVTQAPVASAPPGQACAVSIISTTFDSDASLPQKYPESVSYLSYLQQKRRIPVRYFGDVNATALPLSLPPRIRVDDTPFHLLIFNNPHIGLEDLYRQRALLSHFFHSARELRKAGPSCPYPRQVLVTLCDDQAQRWNLLGCAARSGHICVGAVPLRAADFPEYVNRRHQCDTTFPYCLMVQYYFVECEASVKEELASLYAEIGRWEQERCTGDSTSRLCTYNCEEWLRTAKELLGVNTVMNEATQNHGTRQSLRLVKGVERFSMAGTGVDSPQPLPLIHPKLVSRLLSEVIEGPRAAASSDEDACYLPYLPSCIWTALYRTQRAAEEEHQGSVPLPISPQISPDIPPHLDATLLGRPLTNREAQKLKRYVAGYGPAMKVKNMQHRPSETPEMQRCICAECSPQRDFATRNDLQQHRSAKHLGASPLPPTLYARVHQQIESSSRMMQDAFDDLNFDDPRQSHLCVICGLCFKTADNYEEHLRYLEPIPGEDETELICETCQPPRSFTDRRALEQHRSMIHMQ